MSCKQSSICSCHRIFWCNGLLFFLRKGSNKGRYFWSCWIRDWNVIPGFLQPSQGQLKSCHPSEHVSTAAMQVHGLLKAVEEHVRRTFHKERPQVALEVLNSISGVLESFSIKKSFVDGCFAFQSVSKSWASFLRLKLSDIAPIIDCVFIGKPTASTII